MLKPAYDTTIDAQALKGKRDKQSYYYDHQAHDLPPIAVGETVRLPLPGKKQWTSVMVASQESVASLVQDHLAGLSSEGSSWCVLHP